MRKGSLLVIVGSILLIVGGFLPWISVTNLFGISGSANEGIAVGWEGDGILTAGIGIVLILSELLVRGEVRRWHTFSAAVFAALATAIVLFDFRRILEISPNAGFFPATDIGLYVTLVGSLLALIGCFWRLVPTRPRDSAVTSDTMV